MQVGSVLGPVVDERRTGSRLRIVGAVKFNADKDFEYRDFVRRIKHVRNETSAAVAGLATGRALFGVDAEIVGHASHR